MWSRAMPGPHLLYDISIQYSISLITVHFCYNNFNIYILYRNSHSSELNKITIIEKITKLSLLSLYYITNKITCPPHLKYKLFNLSILSILTRFLKHNLIFNSKFGILLKQIRQLL